MNDPREHPNSESLRKMEIDQMAEQGIPIENSPSKGDQVNKELAKEATWPIGSAKQDASPKAAPAPESEIQEQDNDYYNGMSQ